MIRKYSDWTRVMFARAWVRVKLGNRRPQAMVLQIFLPLVSIFGLGLVYKFSSAPESYLGFVVLGGVMLMFWTDVIWNLSATYYFEKEIGNLEFYMMAPISRMAVLAGMALGGVLNVSLRALGVLLVGTLLFHIDLHVADPLALLLVFVTTFLGLYGLGTLLASLFLLYGREAWQTAGVFQEPVYFLSGLYYPLTRFPIALQLVATAIPLSIGLEAMRKLLIFNGSLNSVLYELAALTTLAIVVNLTAKRTLSFMESLSKREGRLTLKWL